MLTDQHLVETFYLSRPQPQPDQNPSVSLCDEPEDCPPVDHRLANKKKTVRFDEAPPCRQSLECNRVFKMIKKQLSPSAQVRAKLITKRKQPEFASKDHRFLSQFELFFSSFLANNKLKDDLPERKKKKKQTTKKNFSRTHSPSNSEQEPSQEEEEEEAELEEQLLEKRKEKKMTYHQRMKQKIENRIEGIVKPAKDKQIHMVETSDKGKYVDLSSLLRLKDKCSPAQPKLRVIRSGLPIRISELDPKAKNAQRDMLEDHKAKKDHTFYKALQKNCEVVLSQISNYQHFPLGSKSCSRHKSSSNCRKSNYFSYMKETCSNKFKRKTSTNNLRKSMDDADQIKWKRKLQQIGSQSTKNLKKSRQLNGGLRVFQGYCNFIDNKLVSDKERLRQILTQQYDQQEAALYRNV